MNRRDLKKALLSVVLAVILLVVSIPCVVMSAEAQDESYTLDVDLSKEGIDISQELYGLFLEDINSAADGGLNPQMVKNNSFETWYFTSGAANRTQTTYKNQWTSSVPVNFTVSSPADADNAPINANNTNYAILTGDQVLTNNGYTRNNAQTTPAMPLEKDVPIDVYVWTKAAADYAGIIKIKVVNASGVALTNEVTITPAKTGAWTKVVANQLVPTVTELGRLQLSIEGSNGGVLNLDMVSLSPTNTYGYGNQNYGHGAGLRADLVEKLANLKPSFMRFAGGCIVEGVYTFDAANNYANANYYNWENSIGSLEERKAIPNLWGNSNTYGYMQSYGLGYHELLQLCEDWGAEAYPILNAGVLCQVTSGSVAQAHPQRFMEHIFHLIDYCWGDPDSPRAEEAFWAQKRVANGHEEPFDLNYVGIGNENWADKYMNNFNYMKVGIDEYTNQYYNRDITIISACGVTIDDTAWSAGWNWVNKMGTITVKDVKEKIDGAGAYNPGDESKYMKWDNVLMDEHYYVSRDFNQTIDYSIYNDDRYDSYMRSYKGRAPANVFVGETATHTTRSQGGGTELLNKGANSMAAALADAAYWAGVERNSDIVKNIAYAPLFLKVNRQNWVPDMIWFNEYDSVGSSSYYMQEMYANNYGTKQIEAQLDNGTVNYTVNSGAPLIGVTATGSGNTMQGYISSVKITREDGKVLLQDDFTDNRNGWAAYQTTASSTFAIADGKLSLTASNGNTVLWLPDKANDPEWYNYKVEVTAVKTGGNCGFVTGVGTDTTHRYWYRIGASSNGIAIISGNNSFANVVEKERSPELKATHVLSNQLDYMNTTTIVGSEFVAVPTNEEINLTFNFGIDDKLEAGYTSDSVTKYENEYCMDLNPYQSDIYNSVTKDDDYVYIKLVNRQGYEKPLTINLSNGYFNKDAVITTLKAPVDTLVNQVGGVDNAYPVESEIDVIDSKIVMDVPAYSVNVIKIPYSNQAKGDFVAETADNAFTAKVQNATNEAMNCKVLLAIYKNSGAFVKTEVVDVLVPANETKSVTFAIRPDQYPSDEYTYKAFCWDGNCVPIFKAVSLQE